MSSPTLRLTVPGHLRYRSVAVRVVAEACRLVSGARTSDDRSRGFEVTDPFDTAFVSAFMEIYNNIAVHACGRSDDCNIELLATIEPDVLTVELRDTGTAFDFAAIPTPQLDDLPEGGMGIHIARTMLDEMSYEPGPPNVWRLIKRLSPERKEAPHPTA